MKILILSDATSVHTIKWINGLAKKGLDVYLLSLTKPDLDTLNIPDSKIIHCKINEELFSNPNPALSKLVYLKALPTLKKFIKEIRPDILHAHYATSYGLLAALSNFKPFVLSVWGSDVFNFPKNNLLNKLLIKYIFFKAKVICSTSNVMAKEISIYTNKEIKVIPFGINVVPKTRFNTNKNITIGTVKSLEEKYGIKYLIEAFHILKNEGVSDIRLMIVGKGSLLNEFIKLVKYYNIDQYVSFEGFIPNNLIYNYHNMIDIAVYPSIEDSESFGVSVIESMICNTPVVVSDVAGFKEIVRNNETGIIVPRKDAQAIASALKLLITNIDLRKKLSLNGYNHVLNFYDFENNLDSQIKVYRSLVKTF